MLQHWTAGGNCVKLISHVDLPGVCKLLPDMKGESGTSLLSPLSTVLNKTSHLQNWIYSVCGAGAKRKNGCTLS